MHKNIVTLLLSLLVVNISGCATSHQSTLTHVPQKPLWHRHHHVHIAKPNPVKIQQAYLQSVTPEIRNAFLQYQKTGFAPIIRSSGFVRFPYKENEQPIVECQPLNICDIALEPGERVVSMKGGDTARWIFDEVYSGSGNMSQPHALIKPKFPDISSDVVIATTRRIYHIGLVARADHYVRQASFYYPTEMQQQIVDAGVNQAAAIRQQQENYTNSVPAIDPSHLDSNYRITGAHSTWRPVRAFNDGTHVFIEMPYQLRVTDAPVLFVLNSADEKTQVNYRIRNNVYIVDTLFKRAVLVSGVGSAAQQATVTYTG